MTDFCTKIKIYANKIKLIGRNHYRTITQDFKYLLLQESIYFNNCHLVRRGSGQFNVRLLHVCVQYIVLISTRGHVIVTPVDTPPLLLRIWQY